MAGRNTSCTSRRLERVAAHVNPQRIGIINQAQTAASSSSTASVSNVSVERRGLLQGQVAIITGAGQGLGAAAALLFCSEGCRVVACDLDQTKVSKVVADIKSNGHHAIAVAGDVTGDTFPAMALEAAIKNFGRIDILVNNAGFTWDGMLHKMTRKQWDAMLDVHCSAPFRLIQAAAPYMRDVAKTEMKASGKAAPRCILNISSVSGVHGSVGQANYATAKMGVLGLTKTVAKEWGPFNIRCNSISFGFMDTRLTQSKEAGEAISVNGQEVRLGIPDGQKPRAVAAALGRMGTAEEGARAMLMLVSPLSSYVTGQNLEVDGGAMV